MKNRRVDFPNSGRLLGLAAALLLGVVSASADTLIVSENGVWDATTPTTTWSAPNQSWSFSFDISSTPAVSNVTQTAFGGFFDGAYSNFTYTLNGAPVSTALPEITWFSTGYGGLFNVNFVGASFELEGDQSYTGPETGPTIVPGTYDLGLYSGVFLGSTLLPLTGDAVIAEGSPSPTPEPSSLFLLGTGMLGLAYFAGRKLVA
jgi:hypothetical protein